MLINYYLGTQFYFKQKTFLVDYSTLLFIDNMIYKPGFQFVFIKAFLGGGLF